MEAEVLPDEPMPIPEDSMEAGVSLHPQEEASNRNAQRASELLAHGGTGPRTAGRHSQVRPES